MAFLLWIFEYDSEFLLEIMWSLESWRIEKNTCIYIYIQMLLPEIDVLMSCFMMQQKHKSFEKKGVNISMLALQHALFLEQICFELISDRIRIPIPIPIPESL